MSLAKRTHELSPRKLPRQERSRATVDAILEAAAQVFAVRGYAAGTTNRIAERAGVSVGSLYEYFPSKDALLVALFERHVADGESILQAMAEEIQESGADLCTAVRRLVTALVDVHARDPQLHRVLYEEVRMPLRVRRMQAENEDRMTALVERYLEGHPEFRRRDAALAARVVVQTVETLTHKLVIRVGQPGDVEAHLDEIVALVVRYLTAPV